MTFIDFFAGIGGFTAGLARAGFRCVGFCEKDKYAVKSYRAIHAPSEKEWFSDDIQTLEASGIPYADGWTAGFPCQDISISGKQQSGLNGKRSGLFFEIVRLIKGKAPEDKPRWVLLENVKNLLSINGGGDFTEVLYQLSEAGYDCEWQLVNSKSYVPQNRERVFVVGHLRDGRTRKVFPVGITNTKTPVELIGGCQGSRVYAPCGVGVTLTSEGGGNGARTGLYCVGVTGNDGIVKEIDCAYALTASDTRGLNRNRTQNAVLDCAGQNLSFIDLSKHSRLTAIARCLKARYNSGITNRKADNSGVLAITPQNHGFCGEPRLCARAVLTPDRLEKRQNGRRFKECGEESFCLTTQDKHGVMLCDPGQCGVYLKIKEATKKGYKEACPGDCVDFSFPDSKGRRGRVGRDLAHTLMTSSTQGMVTLTGRIRRLTPLECFRLQGFSDEAFRKAQAVNSDNQLYKQIGNGVTVPVIYEIGKKLREVYHAED
jgi:DNA (cytosine-5)-methyltransferase 1